MKCLVPSLLHRRHWSHRHLFCCFLPLIWVVCHPAPGSSSFNTHYPMSCIVPKSCQEHWEMNTSDQSTLGWKAGFCPWHWQLLWDLARHATWAVIQRTFLLAAAPTAVAFTILLPHHNPVTARPLSPILSHTGVIVWPGRKLLQKRDQSST